MSVSRFQDEHSPARSEPAAAFNKLRRLGGAIKATTREAWVPLIPKVEDATDVAPPKEIEAGTRPDPSLAVTLAREKNRGTSK
jgi:hypothetical protein